MFFLLANVEILGHLYSLNSVESGVNLKIQSAHKNVYRLTNLSLAFPTITDFSMKRQLMTGCSAAERPSWEVPGVLSTLQPLGRLAFGKVFRVGHFGVPSGLSAWPGH